MRLFPALAALLAIVAAPMTAAAVAPISPGRGVIPPPEGAPHDSARVRFALIDGRTLGVDIDIAYAPSAKLPPYDSVSIAHETPTVIEARTRDGRPLAARIIGTPGAVITLPPAGEPAPSGIHLRFEQSPPPARRYGWRYALAELQPSLSAFQVTHDVTVSVVVPADRLLAGFECRDVDGRNECTRTMPRSFAGAPLILPAPIDPLGMVLLILTTGAGVYGFERMRRKRAAEHVEHARVIAPIEQPPQDRPGGAYREPPARAVVMPAGDPSEALAALATRARWVAATAIASTIAVAVLAAERTPWPMPSVTAAWIAVVGFVAALVVERS